MKKEFSLDFYGRNITVEIGALAKQANGACLVRYGDTVVLSASVMGKTPITQDFFPLQVLYQEKLYSVGKIPGGFIKREGKPTDEATLAARLIDRPLRPMFDENLRNEIQVVNTVLSVDQNNSPIMSALLGSSLSLGISEIPFDGPIAGVVVGKIGKDYLINPTVEELEQSEINLTVAGSKDAICMVEAGAKEVSDSDMLEAILYGHEAIKVLCEFESKIIKEVGKEKIELPKATLDEELLLEVTNYAYDDIVEAIQIKDKLTSASRVEEIKENTINYFTEKYPDDERLSELPKMLFNLESDAVRSLINDYGKRPDGRKMDEIRPLDCYVTTLGPISDHQILDGLGIEDEKRFMLHYNFPAFSVGEIGRYGAPGRREIGHGALGERALLPVIPSEEEFPYTIRVVSEILESNGSSSQATICAGCLSLMAAGVPISAPVAGIAMGLITSKDGKKKTILTDIQGMEDHMGDMDFKVAGTKKGITALQMDIKIKGVDRLILKEALKAAKKARLTILDVMHDAISEPRKELSPYAPKIETFKVSPEKIKDIIGKGGEMITKIILECSNVSSVNDKDAVKVDLEDDGRVIIYHTDKDIIEKTKKRILDVVREVEEDVIYTGKVVKIESFGCFVELWPGCEGLVHVSELANERINHPSDVVKVGDQILVKSKGYDNRGRLNLSRKAALPKETKKENK